MTVKFPKKIYVKWEKPARDEAFLVAGEEMYGLVELGDKTMIATYQLVETTEAQMVVSAKPPKKAL
jgi:putative Ca2+/H+ antiporter (TMEM165/GDT1 family)